MVKKYREQTVQKMTFSPISVNEIQTGVKVSREIKRMHGFESTEERVREGANLLCNLCTCAVVVCLEQNFREAPKKCHLHLVFLNTCNIEWDEMNSRAPTTM